MQILKQNEELECMQLTIKPPKGQLSVPPVTMQWAGDWWGEQPNHKP